MDVEGSEGSRLALSACRESIGGGERCGRGESCGIGLVFGVCVEGSVGSHLALSVSRDARWGRIYRRCKLVAWGGSRLAVVSSEWGVSRLAGSFPESDVDHSDRWCFPAAGCWHLFSLDAPSEPLASTWAARREVSVWARSLLHQRRQLESGLGVAVSFFSAG